MIGAIAVSLAYLLAPSDRFSLELKNGAWWFKRKSELLWSMGVDCTEMGAKGSPDNPSYDAAKLFPSKEKWAEDTAQRFQVWKVNTLGGWSDHEAFSRHHLPYIEVLHLGSYNKAPWNDLFADEAEKNISDAASKLIPPLKNDPNLIGYCTDNELGWWDDSLFGAYFKFPAAAPGKIKLVQVLREHYQNDFSRFTKDWKSTATGFEGLLSESHIFLRPGTEGIKAVIAFNQALATHYYELVYRLVKREDPTHLILGDRYQQYYNLETVRAAKPYVDVISSNGGADWLDGTYAKFMWENLYRMTGKPVLITEFYFAARENRTGNRNTGEYFPTVQTQVQRAKAFATNLRELASQPWIVGAHWFQFYDEPPKGRGDGEDYNQGLVDIKGVPYEGMVEALKHANLTEHHRKGQPKLTPGVPKAPPKPMAGNLLTWDRSRGYIRSDSPEQWADLYVTYDKENLYIGLCPMEFIDPKSLYEGPLLPEVDRPALNLSIGKWSGTVRYNGEKQKPTFTTGIARVAERPGLKHLLSIQIPAISLGLKDHKVGQKLRLQGSLVTHGRGFKMSWDREVVLN